MTLTADTRQAPGTKELPAPVRERYTPLRAGILNLWEFDEQEFWFADGRLILRGANEAGKSKALEVLLPLLLDASLRPERLDPFGEKVKTMYWNLLEFDPDRKISVGYSWLELGRLVDGEPRFVTIGAGFRAARSGGRRVKSWYFVTHRRVGGDLDLLDGRVPLSKVRLPEALGEDGRVFDHAAEYREAVDRELFGLGKERYDALVHLLLQLRRPHLSAKLDPGELSKVLSDSLPPLEEGRVSALAQAFDRLDEEAEAVAGLERAHRSIRSFGETYSSYARQHARCRAAGVRTSITNLDNVTRRVRTAEDARRDAVRQTEKAQAERGRVEKEIAGLRAAHEALTDSDEMRAAERLEELRSAARTAEGVHDAAGRHLREEEAALATARREADAARRKAEEAGVLRDANLESARDAAARSTMLPHHEAHEERFSRSPREARSVLEEMVEVRIGEVRTVRGLETAVRERERALADARRREAEAQNRLEEAEESVVAARTEEVRAREALLTSAGEWVEAIEEIDVGEDAGGRLIEDVLDRIERGRPIAASADALLGPHREALARKREELLAGKTRLEDERADLDARREEIASEREDGPRPRPGVGPERDSRPGAPLWRVTDFAGDLAPERRAGLEAALEAAGVLDAWVTPEGELLDPTTLDVFLDPGRPPSPARRTLADVLIPTEHPSVGADAVRGALLGVPLVEAGEAAPEDGSWVATDGRWRLGPLVGRWVKEAPEHVGAGAREAARLRRLSEIDARIDDLRVRIEATDRDLEKIGALRGRLLAAREEFPSEDELRSARAGLRAEVAVRDRAEGEGGAAALMTREAEQALEERAGALHAAARDAGLLEHLGALEELERLLGEYRMTLADLASAALLARDQRRQAKSCLQRRDDLGQRCEGRRAEAGKAERDAVAKRSAADTFAAKVGKSVREVLARREEVAEGIRTGEDRKEELVLLLIEEEGRAAKAAEQLRRAEEDRAAKEAEREHAVHALEYLDQVQLMALAVPNLQVAPRPWNVTTATEISRRIEGATKSTPTDPAARDRLENRVHDAFLALRSDLGGDFGPSSGREDGLTIVTVQHLGRTKRVQELEWEIREEIAKRRELLGEQEREVIERHLLTDVGHHLQELISSSRRLVESMNSQLKKHRTNSGQRIRLRWGPSSEADPATRAALDVLRKDVRLLGEGDREALGRFLGKRIREARKTDGAGSSADRQAKALDYRNWHDFVPFVVREDGSERRLTRKVHSAGSGGSRALLIHLPLFAAAAAHYGSAKPEAPRLVLLDEAFAGIDPSQRGSLMGLLVAFDLDFMTTNHDEWGCYPELPGVAVYHLERNPTEKGVAALRFVWNGSERVEDDPFLEEQAGDLPW